MKISKSPSIENMPENINPGAVEIWEHVIRRFADEIYTNRRLVDVQWKCAISNFERICVIRHINPYISTIKNASARLKNLVLPKIHII